METILIYSNCLWIIPLYLKKQQEILIEKYIKNAGITDARVLQAFREVPRHEFVLPEYRDEAYYDSKKQLQKS
ncbi:MAG: hypothetical protein E3K32_14060 [wastewater metagenome]|nr:hypothetical protein [Candidatus Loosdrechtia aerotolerans]